MIDSGKVGLIHLYATCEHKPTMHTCNSRVTEWSYLKQIEKDKDTSYESWKGTGMVKRYKRP